MIKLYKNKKMYIIYICLLVMLFTLIVYNKYKNSFNIQVSEQGYISFNVKYRYIGTDVEKFNINKYIENQKLIPLSDYGKYDSVDTAREFANIVYNNFTTEEKRWLRDGYINVNFDQNNNLWVARTIYKDDINFIVDSMETWFINKDGGVLTCYWNGLR